MKCHVFTWTVNCGSCTPDNFYEFDSAWRDALCPVLIKYVGVDKMNDLHLVPRMVPFNPDGQVEFSVLIPAEHYNDADFDEIERKVELAADDYLGGWSFEQSEDEDI